MSDKKQTTDLNQLVRNPQSPYYVDRTVDYSMPGISDDTRRDAIMDQMYQEAYPEYIESREERNNRELWEDVDKDDDSYGFGEFMLDLVTPIPLNRNMFKQHPLTEPITSTLKEHGYDMFTKVIEDALNGKIKSEYGAYIDDEALLRDIEKASKYLTDITQGTRTLQEVDPEQVAREQKEGLESFQRVAAKISGELDPDRILGTTGLHTPGMGAGITYRSLTSEELLKKIEEDPTNANVYLEKMTDISKELQGNMSNYLESASEKIRTRDNFLAKRRPYSKEFLKAQKKPLFSDIESTIVKIPGLLGSSSSALEWQALRMASGIATSAIMSSGAVATIPGMVATAGLTATNIFAQIKARESESHIEMWEAYKDRVFGEDLSEASRNSVLEQARQQASPNATEEELIVGILIGQYKVQNGEFTRKTFDALQDLSTLYYDNMILSASDVLQTALTVVPYCNALGGAVRGAITGSKFAKAMGKYADNVIEFGLDKKLDNLAKLQRRHKYWSIGGSIVGTSLIEGWEEGVQYKFAQNYLQGIVNENPGFANSVINAVREGTHVFLSPFDRELRSNSEYWENVKGGWLLGGLLGGTMTGITGAVDVNQTTKSSNELVKIMAADYFADRESLRTGIEFAKSARKGRAARMSEAFDFIRKHNLTDADAELLDYQQDRANRIISLANSSAVKQSFDRVWGKDKPSKSKKKDGSELSVKQYNQELDTYVALRDHYNEKFKEANKRYNDIVANGVEGVLIREDGTIQVGDEVFATNALDDDLYWQAMFAQQQQALNLAAQQDAIDDAKRNQELVKSVIDAFRKDGLNVSDKYVDEFIEHLNKQQQTLRKQISGVLPGIPEFVKNTDEYKKAVSAYVSKLYAKFERDHYLNKAVDYNHHLDENKITDKEVELRAELTGDSPALVRRGLAAEIELMRDDIRSDIRKYLDSVEDDSQLQQRIDELNDSQSVADDTPVVATDNSVDPEVPTQPAENVQTEETETLPEEQTPDTVEETTTESTEKTESNEEEKSVEESSVVNDESTTEDGEQSNPEPVKETSPEEEGDSATKEITENEVKPVQHRTFTEIVAQRTPGQKQKERERLQRLHDAAVAENELIRKGLYSKELLELNKQHLNEKGEFPVPKLFDELTPEEQNQYTYRKYTYNDDSLYGNIVNRTSEEITRVGQQLLPLMYPYLRQMYINWEADAVEENDVELANEYHRIAQYKGPNQEYNPDKENFFIQDVEAFLDLSYDPDEAALLSGESSEYYERSIGRVKPDASVRKLAERYLDLVDFRESVVDDIISLEQDETASRSEIELLAEFGDMMESSEIASQESEQVETKIEEQATDAQTIPELSKEFYPMDGLIGNYTENKPFIEESANPDFLESDVYFTVDNDQVILHINYNGQDIKVKFREGYGRNTDYTSHNADIVAKVKALYKQCEGTNKRVVPIGLTRFIPKILQQATSEGMPKYVEISPDFFGVASLDQINPSDIKIGIGHYDGVHVNGLLYNPGLITPGTVYIYRSPKFNENPNTNGVPIQLHTMLFSEQPQFAELIVDLLLNINATNYKGLPISSKDLVRFLMYFGPDTLQNVPSRQAYFDEKGRLIIGTTPYNLEEVRENASIRSALVKQIRDNFEIQINESYLNLKLNALPTGHPLRSIYDYFRLNNNAQSLEIIPGLKFDRSDFGLTSEQKPINIFAWYIKSKALTTSFRKFGNAQLQCTDVAIVEPQDNSNNVQPAPANPKSEETVKTEEELASDTEFDGMSELFGEDFSDLIGPNKRVSRDQLLPEDVSEVHEDSAEILWLKSVLHLTDKEITWFNDIIKDLGDNEVSVGRATESGIALSRRAPSGTGFHEAFHRVMNLFVPTPLRNILYARAAKRYNIQNATEAQIDEVMADKYAEFMLDEGIKLDYQVRGIFNKIKLFVKLARKTNSLTFATLIYNIGKGTFKNAETTQENLTRFKELAAQGAFHKTIHGVPFQHIVSNAQISSITDGLQFALLKDVKNLSDASEIDLEKFGEKIKLIAEKDTKHPVLKDIANNWGFFKDRIVKRLNKIGVLGKEVSATDAVNDEISNNDAGEANGINVGEHLKSTYEFSHYNSAPKEVKFFFSRIAQMGYDADGNMKVVIDPSTGFPRIISASLAWNTVLNDLHHCDSIQSMQSAITKLAQHNIFYKTLLRHFNKYVDMSKSSNREEAIVADTFLTKMLTTIHSHKHMFLTGKIKNREQDGKHEVQIIDNGVDIMSKRYPQVWSSLLLSNDADTIFQTTEKGVVLTDHGRRIIVACRNAYNKLVKAMTKDGILTVGNETFDLHQPQNLDRAENQVVSILNNLGILIDKGTLDTVLRHPSYGDQTTSYYDRFKAFLTSNANFGGIKSILDLYGNDRNAVANIRINIDGVAQNFEIPKLHDESKIVPLSSAYVDAGFAKFLSSQYVKHLQNTKELRSIGAEGNLFYPISQNNYASDHVAELNQRGAVVNDLRSVHWSSSSLILDQLTNPDVTLTLETLIAFRTDSNIDQGRDYFGITDKEDYITKMALTMADRIIFPTVADKKTYHTITGVKLFHAPIRFSSTRQKGAGPRLDVIFPDEVTTQFILYANSEKAAIEQCIEQVNGGIPESEFIQNYHTKNFYKTKEIDPETGKEKEVVHEVSPNGTRFRFLTGVWEFVEYTENGKTTIKEEFRSFNDPKLSAEKNLENANKYFYNRPVEEQRMMISRLLQKQVDKELDYVASLGIIHRPGSAPISGSKNLLLDQRILDGMIEHYSRATDSNGNPVSFVQKSAEGYAIYNMVAQHVVNTIVSVHEIEALFSGDPAYYKWKYDENGLVDISIDKIKRLGALTSTGKNNRVNFADWLDEYYTVAELEDHEVGSQQIDVIMELAEKGNLRRAVRQRYGERALYNEYTEMSEDGERTVREPKSENELREQYPDAVTDAKSRTQMEFGGYSKGINVADAAVYISPKMYKKLMQAIGEFSPEIEDAFNILTDPNTSISAFEKAELYQKLLKSSLKPLKYMATAQRFENGLGVPYFNKMALFPVFDFVATGDMQKVYERMTQPGNELDMIMFNSAVKAGSKNPQSPYVAGQMTDLNNLTTYKQSYRYIRQQLATDPHSHEEQLAGTQMLKVSMSNLELDGLYGNLENDKVTGESLKQTIMGCMKALSDKGAAKLRDRFVNKDGSINEEEFGKMLYEELSSRDANDNMLDGVSVTDGKMKLPLAALSDTNWVESILISMINKATVDIYLPGGAFIQRSTFGLDATRQDVISDRMYNNGKKLNLINNDGSMDAIVSINLFKHFIPGYKHMSFEQARQWLKDNGIIGEAASANAIGYRIPTQSQASISALRFVDVLPEMMGDTIVLPEEFTKLTGSDFDVDKLYVSRFQYETYRDAGVETDKRGQLRTVWRASKIEFDDKKSYSENSEEANKNKLIESYLRILTDKSRTNELKISIDNDTELVKNALKIVESNRATERPETFSVYTPKYQEERKAEYVTGKVGIGPMALNNAHHILTQLFNVEFEENEFTVGLDIVNTNRIYDRDNNRVLSWLSALINAFVDIAKDPYIIRLNVNPWTYNMCTYMIRMGFGEKTFFMLSQPILKDMAEAVMATKGKYGVDQTKTAYELEQEAIQKVLDKYDPTGKTRKSYEGITKADAKFEAYKDLFLTDELKDIITKGKSKYADETLYKLDQVRIYYAYKALQPYAQALADLVKYSKVDTKKTGKTFMAQLVFRNGMSELATNPIFKAGSVSRFFEESFVEKKTANSVDFGRGLLANMLFSCNSAVIDTVQSILMRRGKTTTANEKLLNTLVNSATAQIKANYVYTLMERDGVTYDSLLRGSNSVAARLARFIKDIHTGKHPDLVDTNGNVENALLNYLLPILDDVTNPEKLQFISVSDKFMQDQDSDTNDVINDWERLLEHPSDDVKTLARDLIYYAFITTGDNAAANNFFKFVPNSWKLSSGYAKAIGQAASDPSLVINEDMLYLHNIMNNDLVPTYDAVERRTDVTDQGEESYDVPFVGINSRHNYPGLGRPVHGIMLGVRDANKANVIRGNASTFPKYIKIRVGDKNSPQPYAVYKLAGSVTQQVGKKTKDVPVYILDVKKGYKSGEHQIIDYRVDQNIAENNVNVFDPKLLDDYEFRQILGEKFSKMGFDLGDTFAESFVKYGDTSGSPVQQESQPFTRLPIEGITEQSSDQTINIWYSSGENAYLSNFATRPFTTEIYGEQVQVNSVEQAFQLNKLYQAYDEMDEAKFNELEQQIMSETNPVNIKKLGRSFRMSSQTRSSWDDMSSDVMYKLIKESFQQNPDALQKLLATGDAVLTHAQETSKWKTEFPRILMEVREELRETSQPRQLSLFDNMPQEELDAVEKQKEEHNKKCNR